MIRLVNRQQAIPNGFKFYQAETGWDTDALSDVRGRSFDAVTRALIRHRLGNRWLVEKHGWATDYETVAAEIDAYNALRLSKNPAWSNFIVEDEGGSTISSPFFKRPQGRPGNVAGASRVVAGVKTLLDWLGAGGRPVAKELAENRATVCSTCPMNQPGDWTTFFTAPVAATLRLQLGMKNDLRLETSKDSELHVCNACSCPLPLKVWTPLHYILENMDETVKQRLDPRCWILKEQGSA